MLSKLNIEDLWRENSPPRPCSYLPDESASLEYRVVFDLSAAAYEELLRRGWRKHGLNLFRPACPTCSECRSLRVDIGAFRPSKSQRRILRRNADVQLKVQEPTVSADHIRLYNDYHSDMQRRRSWPHNGIDADEYYQSFLVGEWKFAREFLYYRHNKLIGVGLVDLVPSALSSVYFFHDPAWRPLGPGTFTLLQEIEFARRNDRRWLYLGYWISECGSMSYKANFRPNEMLAEYIHDDVEPTWQRTANSSFDHADF